MKTNYDRILILADRLGIMLDFQIRDNQDIDDLESQISDMLFYYHDQEPKIGIETDICIKITNMIYSSSDPLHNISDDLLLIYFFKHYRSVNFIDWLDNPKSKENQFKKWASSYESCQRTREMIHDILKNEDITHFLTEIINLLETINNTDSDKHVKVAYSECGGVIDSFETDLLIDSEISKILENHVFNLEKFNLEIYSDRSKSCEDINKRKKKNSIEKEFSNLYTIIEQQKKDFEKLEKENKKQQD